MTQQPPERSTAFRVIQPPEDCSVDHWLVYVALLPAILASAAIVMTAVSAGPSWSNRISPILDAMNAMHADPDGYVEELAKLGIAKIPGYEPPSVAGISTVAPTPRR
jgi:hypothetical protein